MANNPLYDAWNWLWKPIGNQGDNPLTVGLSFYDSLIANPKQFEEQMDLAWQNYLKDRQQAQSSFLTNQQAFQNKMGFWGKAVEGWGNQDLTDSVNQIINANIKTANKAGELLGLGNNALSAYNQIQNRVDM